MLEEVAKNKNKIQITTDAGVSERVFESDITAFKIIDDKIIVLIDALEKSQMTRKNCNVFCLDENAEILWQIQKSKADSPFIGLRIMGNGVLRVLKGGSRLADARASGTSLVSLDGQSPNDLDVDITSGKVAHV